jgi:hypothetical protein
MTAFLREILTEYPHELRLRPSHVARIEAYRDRLNTPEFVGQMDDEPMTFDEAVLNVLEHGLHADEKAHGLFASVTDGSLHPITWRYRLKLRRMKLRRVLRVRRPARNDLDNALADPLDKLTGEGRR